MSSCLNEKPGQVMISKRLELALAKRGRRPAHLEHSLHAYHIWGTIGLDFFIKRDGSVIKCIDESVENAVQMTNEVEINAALTASLINVPELSEFLPERPSNAVPCSECKAIGHQGTYVICSKCKSLGWIVK